MLGFEALSEAPLSSLPSNAANAYTLPAIAGALTVAGASAGLRRSLLLSASPGALTISGASSILSKGATLVASPGAFTISGTTSALRRSSLLFASPGALGIGGAFASLLRGRALLASFGALSITGAAAGLRTTRSIPALAGSVQIVGKSAVLGDQRQLVAGAGAFVVTGAAAGLVVGTPNRVLPASAGLLSIGGASAALVYAPVASTPVQTTRVAPGVSGGRGRAINWRVAEQIARREQEEFDRSRQGKTPALEHSSITAGAGAFRIDGSAVSLLASRSMRAAPARMRLVVSPAALYADRSVTIDNDFLLLAA